MSETCQLLYIFLDNFPEFPFLNSVTIGEGTHTHTHTHTHTQIYTHTHRWCQQQRDSHCVARRYKTVDMNANVLGPFTAREDTPWTGLDTSDTMAPRSDDGYDSEGLSSSSSSGQPSTSSLPSFCSSMHVSICRSKQADVFEHVSAPFLLPGEIFSSLHPSSPESRSSDSDPEFCYPAFASEYSHLV